MSSARPLVSLFNRGVPDSYDDESLIRSDDIQDFLGRTFGVGALDPISTAALVAFTLFLMYIVYAFMIGEIPAKSSKRYLSNDFLPSLVPGMSAILRCVEQEEFHPILPIQCIIAPWTSTENMLG
ncbi:unnamed protein product [Meganyctiphanes norvegica]|uniref:Uncharacterized protein n=1 Tax=Meganyctiphanes norvegica TaxID=48144 RepID=A0AAV2QTC8_MEGNR